MANFEYKAKNKKGKQIEGTIEATTEAIAIETLQKKGNFVIGLKKKSELKTFAGLEKFFQRVPLKEKIMFTNQMAVMVKSGLAINDALKTVLSQIENKKLRDALNDVQQDVNSGISFSSALAKHPKIFNETYTKIIESGEKSGRLDKVLIKLSKDLEKDYDLIGKIRSALMYPVFILLVLVIIMGIVLVFVMPQLKNLFDEVGVPLPLPTRVILILSEIVMNYWWLLIAVGIGGWLLLRKYLSTDKGGYLFDSVKLKAPVLKTVLLNIYMSRFARSLSSLTAAGIPMLDVLETTKDVMGSKVFEKEMEDIIKKVESGSKVSQALKESTHFPPVVVQLVAVGEKSGQTEYVLKNLSQFLEREVENTTKNLTSLLEPVLMVILGVGIAVVIASVIMPIYGLVQVIQ